MFGDLNKVMVMGNLTQDPDLRFTTGGTPVLNFSIATNRRYKAGDDWKDEVTYHNVVVWRSAESLAKRIKKGTRIFVEGRMQTRSWDDKETGKKQYKTEIVADNVSLVARYEGGSDSELGVENNSGGGGNSSSKGGSDDEVIEPDDLPF